jgi:co-chaperonin GroES (HSP10)
MKDLLNKFVVLGDRVLIQPLKDKGKTESGLFLPPGVKEKEKIQSGYIMKVGPGYAVSPAKDEEDPWQKSNRTVQYIPLEAKIGDVAIFLQNHAYEIEYEKEKFIIVPQSAILLIIRDEFSQR